jgi:hypothetical protein
MNNTYNNNRKTWRHSYANTSKENFWSYFKPSPLQSRNVIPSLQIPRVPSKNVQTMVEPWHGKDCVSDSDCGGLGRCYEFGSYYNAPKKCVCPKDNIFVQTTNGGGCVALSKNIV